MVGLVSIIFQFRILYALYTFLSTIMLGFYLIYDTQLIMGKFGYGYSVDDDKSPFTLTFSQGLGEVETSTGTVWAPNNMNGVTSIEVYRYVDKAAQTITASDVTATYGDTGKKIEASTTGDGGLSYAVKSGDAVTVDASGNLTIVKAGSAVITVTAAETDTYAQATKDVNVTAVSVPVHTTRLSTAFISGTGFTTRVSL